jgi:hypothetical protein
MIEAMVRRAVVVTVTVLAVATALAACAAALPAVPSKGGPAWRELTSEHFTVWTDADPARARDLVREMERFRQVLVGAAFPSVPTNGRILAILLRDDDELAALSDTGQPRAFASPAVSPLWQPMIVLSARSNRVGADYTLPHELTHVISFGVIHHQPRWLAEGLAKYFETVRLDSDAAAADVGLEPTLRGASQPMPHVVPVAKLFGWNHISEHEEHEYVTAWGLITFLINIHPQELVQYMRLIEIRGESRDPVSVGDHAALWSEAFPSLPLADVDAQFRQWLVTGSHLVNHLLIKRRTWPIAERMLGDADAYAVRGMLLGQVPNQAAAARENLAAAIAAEPTNVLARLAMLQLDDATITVEEARALVAANRADWRAAWLAVIAIYRAHGDAAEQRALRAHACSLIAHNPAVVAPSAMCDGIVATDNAK